MFESAELGHRVGKETWKKRLPELRQALLEAQFDLLESGHTAVVVLIGGVEGAGKGEVVNALNEWMDPRHIRTEAFGPLSEEERQHPYMWRYWMSLPARGKIGILFGSWYTQPIIDRVLGGSSAAELDQQVKRIRHFERMLAQENVLLVKLWFHLTKKQQKKRFAKLADDPATAWRVTATERKFIKHHDRFSAVSEQVLRETSSGDAPWVVIDGSDDRYRSLTAGELLLSTIRGKLDKGSTASPPAPAPLLDQEELDQRNVLNQLDYSLSLSKKHYSDELAHWQRELNLLSRDKRFRERNCICVFEGNDAAGKGGAIRRITRSLDARFYRVIPVAAPSEEERAQPYLWRFWRHLPRHGRFTLFDRSWYGRVLVERVEELCSEHDWMRAYTEINEFEEQLTDHGIILAKFWLAITPEEQLSRFQAREETGYKRFKITEDDWRNRGRWTDYERAVCDMVDRTSTEYAPWTLVEANDKRHARIKVLRTLCEKLEESL
ncbi:MAG: polyphosphate:AMP phosphotransferase [Alcanivoracaceae bacterium]|nr:polyphosphate:AMP phosphotransferase [Alcanivoracaceae bacterium]